MEKYDPQKIEAKWQEIWEKSGVYRHYKREKKFYALDMFPYPSGVGLHVGHPKGYIATDVVSRYKLLQGFSVLHPMGWDAFGLPAENYAIENKIHPKLAVEKNIATFKKQLEMFGFTYDWNREINTTDPEYYKWTQWIFLKMFDKGLAYEDEVPVNWCPSCKTVLANEDLENGKCERCGTQVVQKNMKQWILKMTDYADRLLYDLDREDLNWEDSIVEQQKNWIGRSEGAQFGMKVRDSKEKIEVYTTRLDTVFGMTYAVVAPEHPIIEKLKDKIKNYAKVEKYIIRSQNKTILERTDLQKEKNGIELEGIKVINPFNSEEIPLFVADYILGFYGTGAVMAVPAHDERDWEFARKYNLPIKEVIVPSDKKIIGSGVLIETPEGKFIFQKRDHNTDRNPGKIAPFGGGVEKGESFEACLKRELKEEINLELDLAKVFSIGKIESHSLPGNFINLYYIPGVSAKNLKVDEGDGLIELSLDEALKNEKVTEYTKEVIRHFISTSNFAYTEDGAVVNSEKYSGLTSKETRGKMTAWLEKNKLGEKKVNYKMRDWVFSRQRYWGEPIPIIHCKKCGTVGVPEDQLPVRLPEVKSYEPTGTGEGPLAKITDWVNVACPKCGGQGKRETNTMPQWAGSSWYFLRYIDPKNSSKLIDKKLEKYWMPVDLYVGGAEHATRHLLYARFWHKFLYDIGTVTTKEPFKKLVHVGLILAEDGRKMSKRWNNVINPNDVIGKFGADSIRLYEMFMGPFIQAIAWSTDGVKGTRKFLEKTYKLYQKLDNIDDAKIKSLTHRTVKKVGEDIENFRFNTAISAMMILANEMDRKDKISDNDYRALITMLAPFAPHIAEELWEKLGHKESIFKESWPKYDPKLIKDEEVELVIQVNGKLRDRIKVNADIEEEEAKKLVMESEKIKNNIRGKEIKKVIFVKGKLINIVV
jgi:leucyl-tRNA synthetase